MAISKKDYVAVAHIVQSSRDYDHSTNMTLDSVARRLADYFGEGNPAFDEKRFLLACGVDTE